MLGNLTFCGKSSCFNVHVLLKDAQVWAVASAVGAACHLYLIWSQPAAIGLQQITWPWQNCTIMSIEARVDLAIDHQKLRW